MRLDDGSCHVKTQPGPFRLPAHIWGAVKTVKYVWDVGRGNARALVAHPNDDLVGPFLGSNADFAPR